ncbi:substrate-binding periplasmic protein [Litoribrevibacter euphylliae]|uniref:Substrate-binding periplasmic protein n=1 Tax=Litoribrevibacter euphylliae TaxID=1834034 RepID=A0ABV7H8L1_9GAMM
MKHIILLLCLLSTPLLAGSVQKESVQIELIQVESIQIESIQIEPTQADSSQINIGQDKAFRWCAYFNWPPWIYKNKQGTYSGILVEQLDLFRAKNPDIKLVMKEIDSWKRCQESVALGTTDFILGANKTPEREIKFRYLDRPAFINFTEVGVYSAYDTNFPDVTAIEDLAQFTLAIVRGNSFGKEIDDFVALLPKRGLDPKLVELSTLDQVMKFVALKRADYFFMPRASFQEEVEKVSNASNQLSEATFREVYSVKRSTPVYLAFSKKNKVYPQLQSRWLSALEAYYQSVDFEARVAFHQQQLEKKRH